MRALTVLALLGLAACEDPALSLDLDSGSCVALALEIVDEALLPGWKVTAMVAERVEGEGAWIVAEDPEGRTMLQPWPVGEGIDLSGLGDADEFDLQPGLQEGESWLALDRPGRVRVWRLGPSARGELQEVPGLADFPGPGDWTRRLLFVGDTPHLLAVPVATVEAVPRFQIAALDRQTLTLGPIWPIDYVQDCWGEAPWDCAYSEFPGDSVDMLAVTAAGSMRGGAVLLAQGSPQPEYAIGHDAFISVLTLYIDEAGGPPISLRKDGWSLAGTGSSLGSLQGLLATDGRSLFSAASLEGPPGATDELQVGAMTLDPTFGSDRPQYLYGGTVGALLQLGARAVVGEFAQGRLSLTPLDDGRVDTTLPGSIALDPDVRVTSAGREQLLLRPISGPARRVRARGVPAG